MRTIIKTEECVIQDSGLYFGKGLFETILVKEIPEFLDFHLKRLDEGLKKIGLNPIEHDLRLEIEKLKLKNLVLKIIVTEKNIIFKTREIPYKKEDYEKGFKLKISTVKRNSTSIINKIKSLNYLENLLEKEKAGKEGFNDCIFFNEKGNLCETSTGNIFIIKNKKIFTPNDEEGLLNGTIREFILNEFDVTFKNFKIDDLKDIDEIFLTNSIIGIMKIKSIDNYKFKETNITEKIIDKYIEKMRRV